RGKNNIINAIASPCRLSPSPGGPEGCGPQTTAEKILDHPGARPLEPAPPAPYLAAGLHRSKFPPMKGRLMFASLARLFGQPKAAAARPLEPRLAVAALLVHLASVDGASNRIEIKAIADA